MLLTSATIADFSIRVTESCRRRDLERSGERRSKSTIGIKKLELLPGKSSSDDPDY